MSASALARRGIGRPGGLAGRSGGVLPQAGGFHDVLEGAPCTLIITALNSFDFVGYTDSMTANTLIRRELLSDQGRAVLAAMPPPESF